MLHTTIDALAKALRPIIRGEVSLAGFDTETTEVLQDRYTPYATSTRMAGFSFSYDLAGKPVDFYAAVRHQPYDWRRRRDLIEADTKRNGAEWVRMLLEQEGVEPPGADGELFGWQDGWNPNLPLDAVLQVLQETLHAVGRHGITLLAHNWPFDAKQLDVEGLELPWEWMEDTQALSVFTDPRPLDKWDPTLREGNGAYVHGGHSLKHLGEAHLGRKPEEQAKLHEAQEVLGAGGAKLNDYSMLPLRTVIAPYACQDTRLLVQLHAVMVKREAYALPGVQELLAKHMQERKLGVDMERAGLTIDKGRAEEFCKRKEQEVAALVVAITTLAGRVLPLNNGKLLAEALYDDLGFPTYRSQRDTRQATLKQVRTRIVVHCDPNRPVTSSARGPVITVEDAAHLIDAILDYRRVSKELGTFYQPLTVFGDTGRVHPVMSPLRARTTRWAVEKPAVQQMPKPKKGQTDDCVRSVFVPEDGHALLCWDYSQQELRIAAHYALAIPEVFEYRFTWGCTLAKRGDCKGRAPHGPADDIDACRQVQHAGYRPSFSRRPAVMGLVDGFLSGDAAFDPHAIMLKWCHDRGLTDIDRDKGKTADFAIIYGAGIAKLMETLDCSFAVARELLKIFWDVAYPELGRVRQFIEERLRKVGPSTSWSGQPYITTLHGAPIYLDGGYKGLNYVVQRGGRELLLNAICAVDEYTRVEHVPYRMVLPLHDELIMSAPVDSIDAGVCRDISRLMVAAAGACQVPHVVQPNVCYSNWAEKETLPDEWGYNGVKEAQNHVSA